MTTTALKVVATKGTEKITTTINDVNPNATNSQLATLATKFNAFTTNAYQKADKVTTVNVDTEPDS